ncbi:MAG: UbiA family prenyltransferase [Candidatus Hadarchaeales archaeon]
MKGGKSRAWLEIIRLHNCIFAGAAVLIGGMISAGPALVPLPIFAIGFFVAVLVAAGGNAINDYADREIDRINRPERPIPSGKISPEKALDAARGLFIAGILLSLLMGNLYCFFLAAANSIALIAYAGALKRRGILGNITIGYLVGSTFLFGGLSTSPYRFGALVPPELLTLVLMAGLATVGRELIKAIEDVEGDRRCRLKTFPIVYGKKRAAWAAALFTLAAVVISPLPYLGGIFGEYYLYPLILSVAAFSAGITKIIIDQKAEAAGKASLAHKIGMCLGLVAFIAGALSRIG